VSHCYQTRASSKWIQAGRACDPLSVEGLSIEFARRFAGAGAAERQLE
jgi:hypothetical protein